MNETANLLLVVIEGHLQKFVRGRFRQSPLVCWQSEWILLSQVLVAYK